MADKGRSWAIHQTWRELLFAHWRVPLHELRRVVPEPLEIDTFNGEPWLGVVPFLMTGIRGHFMPPLPGMSRSLELNVRTYVRYGDYAGVYFFSLDAENWPFVLGGRSLYSLPYFHARMKLRSTGDRIAYRSRRSHPGSAALEFEGEYGPVSGPYVAAPGSLDSFLTDRYSLFTVTGTRVSRADIRHAPWPLQRAGADLRVNTMAQPLGIELTGTPLLHFSRSLDVLVWWPTQMSL